MGVFKMPSLGADMDAGKLVEWLVKPGDSVKHGDIIAVVETQKGAIEVEVFEDGTVGDLLVGVGETVPVGTPLAHIAGAGEPVPEVSAPPPPPEPAPAPAPAPVPAPAPEHAEEAPAPPPQAPPPLPEGQLVSPAARRLAAERGIDLSSIKGTGPVGAVISSDLPEGAHAEKEPARKAGIDLIEMRKAIAAAMAKSKRDIPHYYLAHTVDLTAAEHWLTGFNEGHPPAERLLLAALTFKAAAKALKDHPEFNGHFENSQFTPAPKVHLGMAVSIRGGGLIAPAIHDADSLTLAELMAHMRELTARVRAGRLRSSELTDGSATVSSLGDRGVEVLYPIIYPPQVCIIGFGAPQTAPAVVDTEIVARRQMTVTLAGDHRANDGHKGALLLRTIDQYLQTPEAL